MKKRLFFVGAACWMVLAVLTASCDMQRGTGAQPEGIHYVKSVSYVSSFWGEPFETEVVFHYDSIWRLSRVDVREKDVAETGTTISYAWRDAGLTVTCDYGDRYPYTCDFSLDGSGRVTSLKTTSEDGSEVRRDYTYGAEGLARIQSDAGLHVGNIEWRDGNIVSADAVLSLGGEEGSDTGDAFACTYGTYDNDYSIDINGLLVYGWWDCLWPAEIVLPRFVGMGCDKLLSSFRVESFGTGTSTMSVTYETDSAGRIVRITTKDDDGDSASYSFTYYE
ncbi:MAG TPA: hypothetical protein H9866_07790 [Candidatus Tidjanibacter gallistercoris]|nr:hypothetical protein [Candidatus Tidjanibacter gallistercoris]